MSLPQPPPPSRYQAYRAAPPAPTPEMRPCGLPTGASHDVICAWLLGRVPDLLALVGFSRHQQHVVEVEKPLTRSRWADLWIQYGAEHAVLVEVKSSHEDFSAGGLLRQLKDYQSHIPEAFKHVKIVVVSDQPAPNPSAWNLLFHEGFDLILCPADFNPFAPALPHVLDPQP